VGFGEFHPRQPNDSADGRNANRRVAILVLEQVAPGATMTVRSNGQTPRSPAPGVELADGSTAGNRLLSKTPVADIDKTILVKDQAEPTARAAPREPMAPHIGPAELAWPAVRAEGRAPAPTHE
jgi:hypothetical protein